MPRVIKKRHFLKVLIGIVVTVFAFHFTIYKMFKIPVLPKKKDIGDTLSSIDMALTTQPPLICKENTSVQKFPKFDDQPQAMKDFLTYRHCKSFPQLIKSTMKCGGPNKSKDIFLLLAIKSSPGNYERREAIRKTWGAEEIYRNVQVRRLFLTGIPKSQQEEKRLNKLLEIESHTYGDILQWNFQDTFYNLTLKQIMFHQWVQTWCPDVQFIFNGDDDVFVNTFNVLAYLYSLGKNGRTNHLFVGQLNIGMPPVRESYSKYYVPEELFSGNLFLPYCGGGGIIMSGFTTQSIFKASKKIPLFPIDDAYLGMCLDQAGLKPDNHEGMKTYGISLSGSVDSFDPCYYQYMLMVHRFMPYEMLVMWNALQIKRFGCKRNTNSQKLNKQKQ